MTDFVCPNCGASCAVANADPVTRPIVYEIHVTVKNARVPEFQAACAALDVKSVLLELQREDHDSLFDLMTSSTFRGEDQWDAQFKTLEIGTALTAKGFEVIRYKIETVPWHPAARKRKGDNQYFETHLPITLRNATDAFGIGYLANEFGLHLSRNTFKKNADGTQIVMATYRTFDDVDTFLERTHEIADAIRDAGFTLDKIISEFAIYDSKVEHDSVWTGGLSNPVNSVQNT